MSIKIQSPVERWPGTITLKESVGYPALIEWNNISERAIEVFKNPGAAMFGEDGTTVVSASKNAILEWNAAIIPGILLFVEKWELGGGFPESITADNFPAVPPADSDALITALIAAIRGVISGNNDPNA